MFEKAYKRVVSQNCNILLDHLGHHVPTIGFVELDDSFMFIEYGQWIDLTSGERGGVVDLAEKLVDPENVNQALFEAKGLEWMQEYQERIVAYNLQSEDRHEDGGPIIINQNLLLNAERVVLCEGAENILSLVDLGYHACGVASFDLNEEQKNWLRSSIRWRNMIHRDWEITVVLQDGQESIDSGYSSASGRFSRWLLSEGLICKFTKVQSDNTIHDMYIEHKVRDIKILIESHAKSLSSLLDRTSTDVAQHYALHVLQTAPHVMNHMSLSYDAGLGKKASTLIKSYFKK